MAKPNRTVKTHAPTKPANVSHDSTKNGSGPMDTFDCLLRANFDKLRTAESDTADVGEDIVGNDKADRQEEPDHALKDVVHDEVGLYNNQIKRHVGPGELSELEFVVALLERSDEENEACDTSVVDPFILKKSYIPIT